MVAKVYGFLKSGQRIRKFRWLSNLMCVRLIGVIAVKGKNERSKITDRRKDLKMQIFTENHYGYSLVSVTF